MFLCQWWIIPGWEVRSEPCQAEFRPAGACPLVRTPAFVLGAGWQCVCSGIIAQLTNNNNKPLCCDHLFVPWCSNCSSHTYPKFSSRFLHASQLAQHLPFISFYFLFPRLWKMVCFSVKVCHADSEIWMPNSYLAAIKRKGWSDGFENHTAVRYEGIYIA